MTTKPKRRVAGLWDTPAEALEAARTFVAALGPDEWVEEAHFDRDWPGGDHEYEPYWSVKLRVLRVVSLGKRGFERTYQRGSLATVQRAYEYSVRLYSKIDGRDWEGDGGG